MTDPGPMTPFDPFTVTVVMRSGGLRRGRRWWVVLAVCHGICLTAVLAEPHVSRWVSVSLCLEAFFVWRACDGATEKLEALVSPVRSK